MAFNAVCGRFSHSASPIWIWTQDKWIEKHIIQKNASTIINEQYKLRLALSG